MNNFKMKHQWLSLLLGLGRKPKADGVEWDDRTQKHVEIAQDGQSEPRRSNMNESDSAVADLHKKNDRPPVMPTRTKPFEDPFPVEGQRSVNEEAYDYDVRRLI